MSLWRPVEEELQIDKEVHIFFILALYACPAKKV